MFFAHGMQIALGKFGGPGVKGFSMMLSGLGFSPAVFWSALAGYSILIGGAMLILGIFTRIACIPLMIFMLFAMIKVHWAKGFFITNGGYEYNLIAICSLIALMMLGGGKISLINRF
jgi:putative oxidoreductase